MNDQSIRLSAEQRGRLRKAISAHSHWAQYRRDNACSMDAMTASQLLACAAVLGIDYATLEPIEPTYSVEASAIAESEESRKVAFDTYMAPHHAKVAQSDKASQLMALIGSIAGDSLNPAQISDMIDARIAAALGDIPTTRLECRGLDNELRVVSGHRHPMFETLVKCASGRMANGYTSNVLLVGPTGSGKTHACQMLAESLGLAFRYTGAVSSAHELAGFVDAAGNYHRTPFRDAYEHGGVICLDEVDGSDANAALWANAPLSNSVCEFPDAQVVRHKDCIIVATANTYGMGATADYVGRNKLDGAFIARFPTQLSWGYDEALEIEISGDAQFARRVIAARKRASDRGLKVIIHPRHSQAGAVHIATGFSSDEAAALTYLAPLKDSDRATVEGK